MISMCIRDWPWVSDEIKSKGLLNVKVINERFKMHHLFFQDLFLIVLRDKPNLTVFFQAS